MKLYETYFALENLWERAASIISGEETEGPDGLPLDPEVALGWIEAELSRIEDTRDAKALNIACMVKNLKAEASAIKDEKQRLARRQQACERTAERLTQYLSNFLEPGTRVKDSRAAISWRKSEGVQLMVSPRELPQPYQRIKVEADLNGIKAALKDGQEVEGAMLETRQNLQIR